jgi:hypothetical protein
VSVRQTVREFRLKHASRHSFIYSKGMPSC